MSLNRTLNSLKIASLFGSVLGLGFGCVVTLSPLEPCASGSNNKLDENDDCECRIGYEWCNPNDMSDLDCCEIDNGTSGPGDGDGDTSGDGDGQPGDGDGDGDGDPGDGDGDGDGDACAEPVLPPESCLPEEEGFAWCTNSDPEMPQCGDYYLCIEGVWTLSTDLLDGDCQFLGSDFAYGCWDDPVEMDVVLECGDGPGTACNSDTDLAFCQDSDVISYCYWDRETWDSCLEFCQTVGIDMQTYEYGECDDSDPNDVVCACCDQGDEGCPL